MDREQAMREAAEESYSLSPWTMAFEGRDPTIATAGADAERARIVAWLRQEYSDMMDASCGNAEDILQAEVVKEVADAIEAGQHWSGE